MTIPKDDAHRFLCWQPRAADCYEWSEYLTTQGVEHVIMKNQHGEHTIYKHMAVGDDGKPCCLTDKTSMNGWNTKPISYREMTGHYTRSS